MIDTHAHLTEKVLLDNIDNVIKNATENGVEKIICVGMNKKANDIAVSLAKRYDNIYATVGLHPSEVSKEKLDIKELESLLKHDKVVGIGEIGIDLYWSKENYDLQKQAFIKQIKLAKEKNLPVVIHSRNSADVIFDIVSKHQGLRGVMHCYSEHKELVEKYVELGFYLGFGGIVTFKNAKEVVEILKMTPLDKILLETDSPYLAPAPFRGKTNEPAYLKYVLVKLAEIKGIKEEQLKRIIRNNTYNLFTKMKKSE